MKHFTKLTDELFAVKKAGYKLDPTAERETDFSGLFEGLDYYERENRICDELDSFCDLDGAQLCTDENGDLYAVEFHYTGKAIIWQKVIKA